jgi:hypothetical protein
MNQADQLVTCWHAVRPAAVNACGRLSNDGTHTYL